MNLEIHRDSQNSLLIQEFVVNLKNLVNPRIDIVDPKCTKSSALIPAACAQKLRKLSALPRCTWALVDLGGEGRVSVGDGQDKPKCSAKVHDLRCHVKYPFKKV